MKTRFLQGDCVEKMRELPMESVDAIVCDPPYSLGFMNRTWDSHKDFQGWCTEWGVEALRSLKPGGYLLAFGGTRTYHRLTAGLEDAGFEIRDCLMWLFFQGFPKNNNALKPSYEPIMLGRKPLDGTTEECVTSYGTGRLNITGAEVGDGARWPSHLLLSHNKDCVQVGVTTTPGRSMNRYTDGPKPFGGGVGHPHESTTMPDEEIEVWDCAPGCPANELGQASRFFYASKVSALERDAGLDGFDLVAAGGMEGRNDGSMGSITYSRNHHPTVKPVDLMRYLVRLVTPPHGTVLDPFMGSGSTGIAAHLEGRDFLGIEQDKEYMKIARARIAHWSEHGENTMAVSASDRTRERIRETGQMDVFDMLGSL